MPALLRSRTAPRAGGEAHLGREQPPALRAGRGEARGCRRGAGRGRRANGCRRPGPPLRCGGGAAGSLCAGKAAGRGTEGAVRGRGGPRRAGKRGPEPGGGRRWAALGRAGPWGERRAAGPGAAWAACRPRAGRAAVGARGLGLSLALLLLEEAAEKRALFWELLL